MVVLLLNFLHLPISGDVIFLSGSVWGLFVVWFWWLLLFLVWGFFWCRGDELWVCFYWQILYLPLGFLWVFKKASVLQLTCRASVACISSTKILIWGYTCNSSVVMALIEHNSPRQPKVKLSEELLLKFMVSLIWVNAALCRCQHRQVLVLQLWGKTTGDHWQITCTWF